MPNSLKCRLKSFAQKGYLSEKDLSRIYTDNDVVEELEKIKEKVAEENKKQKLWGLDKAIKIIDNRIKELKGEKQ